MKVLKWLSVADRLTKAYLDEKLAPLGINSSQHMYILKICANPGIQQDSLLESVYVHPSSIVRVIAALEKKGFLTRMPNELDRRTWRLYPTEKAMAVVEKIRTACADTEAVLMEGLSGEERADFCAVLFHAGKQMAGELQIERREDEFDE